MLCISSPNVHRIQHFALTLQTARQKALQSNLICGSFTQSYVYIVAQISVHADIAYSYCSQRPVVSAVPPRILQGQRKMLYCIVGLSDTKYIIS